MTQIGIGDMKHAQKSASKPMEELPIEAPALEVPDQEGQLAVDVLQTENEMTIVCPIAGVKKEDLQVSLQEDVLTIRGDRKQVVGGKHYQSLVSELFWGTFSRSIVLPDHIDRKNIKAKVHEHLLIITIPKTEDFRTRVIHISEES